MSSSSRREEERGKECIIKAKRENESMLTHANHVIAKDTKVNVSHGQLHVKVSSFFEDQALVFSLSVLSSVRISQFVS